MNKLQLYITMSYNGFHKKFDHNSEPGVAACIYDLSEALENIRFITREKHIFYVLKYTPQGTFIVVLRTIPDSNTDHLAAWVFVPAGIEIKPNDLTGIVGGVANILSNSKISQEDISRLRQLFDRTYPDDPRAARMVENYGVQYAHRYYGSDTGYRLTDLIGNARYQTAYLPYAGMILADKDDVDGIEGNDLTGIPPRRMVRMLPPEVTDTPYVPTIFNQPFDEPFLVPMGGVAEVVWTARGLDDIVETIEVTATDLRPEPVGDAPAPVGAEPAETAPAADTPAEPYPVVAEVADDEIPVVAEDTPAQPAQPEAALPEGLQPGDILVEPEDDDAAETPAAETPAAETPAATDAKPAAPEREMSAAERFANAVALDAPMAEGMTIEDPSELDVPVAGGKRTYRFEIPTKASAIGSPIMFEIKTRADLTESPIEGYDLTDTIAFGQMHTNHLVYNGEGTTRSRLIWGGIGAVAGILLTLLVSWMMSCGSGSPAAGNDSTATGGDSVAAAAGRPAAAQPSQPGASAADITAAVQYLDSNKVWEKGEMEALPALQGLFDDMNNFRLQTIIDVWGPKLSASEKFAKLVQHARNSLQRHIRLNGTYNRPDDTKITYISYIYKIEP